MFRSDAEDMMAVADDMEALQLDNEVDILWQALAFLNEATYLDRMDAVNDTADILERYASIPIVCE